MKNQIFFYAGNYPLLFSRVLIVCWFVLVVCLRVHASCVLCRQWRHGHRQVDTE